MSTSRCKRTETIHTSCGCERCREDKFWLFVHTQSSASFSLVLNPSLPNFQPFSSPVHSRGLHRQVHDACARSKPYTPGLKQTWWSVEYSTGADSSTLTPSWAGSRVKDRMLDSGASHSTRTPPRAGDQGENATPNL